MEIYAPNMLAAAAMISAFVAAMLAIIGGVLYLIREYKFAGWFELSALMIMVFDVAIWRLAL